MPKMAADTSGEKSLEKIMKVDLLRDKTPEEITEIWTKYFSQEVTFFLLQLTTEELLIRRNYSAHYKLYRKQSILF